MTDPVVRIELFHVTIPLPATFYPSWIPYLPQTQNNFTLLRLTTKSGLVGHSAGVAMEHERAGLGSLLGPYLLEADALDIPVIQQRLREASYLGWRNSWIEAAFWDIKAKAEGKPLYKLLAGTDDEVADVEVYLSMGEVSRGDALERYLDEAAARGVRAVKLRVHDEDEEVDQRTLQEAREHVGSDFALMVDANQGWRVALLGPAPLWDLSRATRFGRVCDELDFTWIEEPLEMYDYDAQAELRRRVKTRIAGGELNGGWHEFKVMLEKGSYDVYQPDVTLAGGIGQACQLMDACAESDEELHFSPHTWTNGLGFLINLQVYAACPRKLYLEYPYQPPGWVPEGRDGLLRQTIDITPRGTVAVPQQPGIGIDVDPAKLRRFGKRFYNLTKPRLIYNTIRSKGLKTAMELGRIKKEQGGGQA